MPKQVAVSILVPPEAEPSVVVGSYDSFWSAGVLWNRVMGEREEPRFKPELVGLTRDPITTATGVRLLPDRTFADGPPGDVVLVPTLLVGSGREFGRRNPVIVDWVRHAHDLGRPVFSICTGAFLLAEAGLLDSCDATTHWGFVDQLRSEYPRVKVHGSRVLVASTPDARVVTCGGAASWMDMVLYLVGRFASPEVAMQLAKVQMLDWHHNGQTPYARLTTRPQTVDGLIHECQEWLADHYAEADPVKVMIERSGLSRRSFGRRFHVATGHAPLDYVQRVRIEEAKQLLETSERTVEQVGADVGYADTVSFRRLFKRMVGETPALYRRRQSVSKAAEEAMPRQRRRQAMSESAMRRRSRSSDAGQGQASGR
jgi:transcriptional regulator GlxA family with amidase domain